MYAVVCSEKTQEVWPRALSTLEKKYGDKWPGETHVILYKYLPGVVSVRSCLKELTALRPHYTCFLTHHSECSKDFVQQVNRLTRELDPSHPYTDTIWGILTGLVEDDVLSALDHDALIIGQVAGNCPVDLEKFKSGVWFSEFERGVSYKKLPHHDVSTKERCPQDTTELIVNAISAERQESEVGGVDMIISSGHATEENWNIAYSFKGGKFLCNNGQLYGTTVTGERIDVT